MSATRWISTISTPVSSTVDHCTGIDCASIIICAGRDRRASIDWRSMTSDWGGAVTQGLEGRQEGVSREVEYEPLREAELFGTAVHHLRLEAGLSLNQLARRAGVDPAYIHRIEAIARSRSTSSPKRP